VSTIKNPDANPPHRHHKSQTTTVERIIMNRIAQTAFPSRYIQGPGAIKLLPSIVQVCPVKCCIYFVDLYTNLLVLRTLQGFGTSGLLIVDPFVHDHILPSINLNGDSLVTEVFGGECTEEEIQRLVDAGKKGSVSSVIGLGGGKVRLTCLPS
jgi:glycerol dehydrogenase